MNDLHKSAQQLLKEVKTSASQLNLEALLQEKSKLEEESKGESFWQDNLTAQKVMKRLSGLESRTAPWQKLISDLTELNELIKLNDQSLEADIQGQLLGHKNSYQKLKADLRFRGPYDDHNAIISIYAGAGGTDAQDWTQILFRMYVRWAEKKRF